MSQILSFLASLWCRWGLLIWPFGVWNLWGSTDLVPVAPNSVDSWQNLKIPNDKNQISNNIQLPMFEIPKVDNNG